ncbi:hypothetical protein CY35_16G081700 [Sphagnum magellanicum]|nr:hypothetical protein CY35_16G081700 [Sphagnum magellanicum]
MSSSCASIMSCCCCSSAVLKIILVWSCSLVMVHTAAAAGTLQSDALALQRFREGVDTTGKLQSSWSNVSLVCSSWFGVECSSRSNGNRVTTLKLPLSDLVGTIPNNSLGELDQLRTLSLHNNFLTGPFPGELGNCDNLRALYLATNNFSGALPSLEGFWPRLTHLSLGFNNFSGSIPNSLNFFQELSLLDLENNSFSGSIPPSLKLASLQNLTLQNNDLSGPVPSSLQSFPAADFAGNPSLCGPPISNLACPLTAPASAPAVPGGSSPAAPVSAPSAAAGGHGRRRRLRAGSIAAIAVGASIVLVLLTTAILLCCWQWRKKGFLAAAEGGKMKSSSTTTTSREQKDDNSSSAQGAGETGGGRNNNKLVFFDSKRYSFDLEDLLRASAEVLGKGSVGTAYKAVLEDGTIVAVKRLKDTTTTATGGGVAGLGGGTIISSSNFQKQITSMGRLQHPNVVPLRAYYFSKDEKLLVYDFYSNGSLSSFLHGGNRGGGGGRAPLDWVARVRIALGAAKGIAYLHQEGSAHGNIKSSNILINQQLEAAVSDFGLVQLVGTSSGGSRNLGYCAPEVSKTFKLTFKSDVYSFGVVLLELLTGKAPTQSSLNDQGLDLPRWVQSVVREEWTVEVFDVDLMKYQNNVEEEMVQMLQLAMTCVNTVPESRPKMADVVHLLEDVHQFSDNNGDEAWRQQQQPESDSAKDSQADTPSYMQTPSE